MAACKVVLIQRTIHPKVLFLRGKGKGERWYHGRFHERHYCWLGDNATRASIQSVVG
ncbi:hypothetical protein BJV77DRAFT_1017851 [Russula vinacea]|nr:hypothetical protein BJV77DRAFT_1017851 [Russula vinacea]